MKVTCDTCGRIGNGSRDDLINEGWCRAVVTTPLRHTFTGCPSHAKDAMRAAVAAIDAEQASAGGRRVLEG